VFNFAFRCWRIVATGFAFAFFGLGSLIAAILLSIFLYPFPVSAERKRSWARAIVRCSTRFYIHSLKALGLLTFELNGIQELDVKGQVVVANHPSLLDAVFLMAFFPNVTCIVKASMATNFFTSRMVALADYIPNSVHGEGMVELAVEALESGQTLVIFPEGTRTENFDKLKFRRGAANIALAANAMLQPIVIDCTPPTLRKHEAWYHVPKTRPHFSFEALPALHARDCVDTERSNAIQARRLSEHLLTLLSRSPSLTLRG